MHIPGIAEHATVGTIVALDDQQWSIEDDDGRTVYVPVQQFTTVTKLQIGDRVEVQPTMAGTVVRPYNWTIIRKLN